MYQHLLVRQSPCLSPLRFLFLFRKHRPNLRSLRIDIFQGEEETYQGIWYERDSMNGIHCQQHLRLDPSPSGHEIFIRNSKIPVMNTVQLGPIRILEQTTNSSENKRRHIIVGYKNCSWTGSGFADMCLPLFGMQCSVTT